ncbi:hypothetical protein ACFTAO_04855 [Paenibacillus rhizoplanae]
MTYKFLTVDKDIFGLKPFIRNHSDGCRGCCANGLSFKALGNFAISAFNRSFNGIVQINCGVIDCGIVSRSSPTFRADNFGVLEIGNTNAKLFNSFSDFRRQRILVIKKTASAPAITSLSFF